MFVFQSHRNHQFLFYDFIEKLNDEKKVSPQWYRMLTEVNDFLIKVINAVQQKLFEHKIIYISRKDLWSLDYTLSHVILASLISFKEKNTISIPFVDCEDVPEDMSYKAHDLEFHEVPNDLLEERWQYVLDQMIEAFIIISEDSFNYADDEEIVNQGLKMFGKYYRNLWI